MPSDLSDGSISRGEGTSGRPRKRSLIRWEVPHMSGADGTPYFIEMYINPQNIDFQSNKITRRVFTKGGYILQYWGEGLDQVNIRGTTGSGGIEALNALRDIYRSEQLALVKIVNSSYTNKRRQSLGQLAASVIMWYQGQGLRGYFETMSFTESADKLGMFEYTLAFVVAQIIGKRANYLPWHRKPWSTSDTPLSSEAADGQTKIGNLNVPPYTSKTASMRPSALQEDPKREGKSIYRSDLIVSPSTRPPFVVP